MVNDVLAQLESAKTNATIEVGSFELELSNLDKQLWPNKKGKAITKRDYLTYLTEVSPVLLPHMKNRPVTLVRFPNGISGQKFFQKHWEHKLPGFVDTVKFYSKSTNKDQDYILCNNLATLLWLGQIADLELHTVHAKTTRSPDARKLSSKFTGSERVIENSVLNYPDYLVLDLDPYIYSGKEAKGDEPALNLKGFKQTCRVALILKTILDSLAIEAFVKTTGKTGLHIYIPIIRNLNYDEVRSFAELLGQYLKKEKPRLISLEWAVQKRTGKIFFDHNMNARGKTLATIYSPRAAIGAPVSTPIQWNEMSSIYPTNFTINNIPERIDEVGDVWSDIQLHKSDLAKVLAHLGMAKTANRNKR